jgi:hypothetical protein
MTIAEQIKRSLDTITDWTSSWEIANFGVCFNKAPLTVFNDVITKYADTGDWLGVACTARMAELSKFKSAIIDEKLQAFLTNVGMFTSAKLPKNVPTDAETPFHVKYFVVLNGYRWAKELDYEKEKWDINSGYQGFKSFRRAQTTPFYACNIDTSAVKTLYGGTWDSVASLASIWLNFYRQGVTEALDLAEDEWFYFLDKYWKYDHFKYAPENEDYQMRAESVFKQFMKVFLSDLTLPFFTRITADVERRFLVEGWGSPQWGGKNVVVTHYPNVIEERLDATLGTYGLLHMLYRLFEERHKNTLKQMLSGEKPPKASEALLNSSLFDTASNRFRNTPTGSPSDIDTCWGCATLFLTAIQPDTGCLAVPITAEGFEEWDHAFFNSNHFGFNYDARQIKIPAYAGKLKLNFGTQVAEAKIPYDGIWLLTFSSDWNSIVEQMKVSDLDAEYLFPPKKLSTVEALTITLTTMLAAFPIWFLGKEVVRKVKGAT